MESFFSCMEYSCNDEICIQGEYLLRINGCFAICIIIKNGNAETILHQDPENKRMKRTRRNKIYLQDVTYVTKKEEKHQK